MHELKNAIESAHSILIVLPNNALDKDYLAALQIQKMAPEKTHLLAPEDKERTWDGVFGNTAGKKEFMITVDTALSPVEELRYEKENGKLTIFLAHRFAFNQGALSFEEYVPAADLIITVGFGSRKIAEQYIELMARTGAARHVWLPEQNGERLNTHSLGLLGRLMARSREDSELGVLWSFLTREDFEKSGSGPESIPALMQTMQSIALLPRATLIFWQSPDSEETEGIVWSQDRQLLSALSAKVGEALSNNEYCGLPHFSNFIEAETAARKLLRTTL